MNRDRATRGRTEFAERAGIELPDLGDDFGSPESVITTAVDVSSYVTYKRQAMRAHASQISEQSFFLAMPDEAFGFTFGTEWFIREGAESMSESDLFG
jgi:LmbE family N-acetylglucosaminyl deacetylase